MKKLKQKHLLSGMKIAELSNIYRADTLTLSRTIIAYYFETDPANYHRHLILCIAFLRKGRWLRKMGSK